MSDWGFRERGVVKDLIAENDSLRSALTMARYEHAQKVEEMQRQINLLTRERDAWKEHACLTLNDLWKLCLESELWKKIHQPKPSEKQAKLKSLLAKADRLLGKGGGK